MRRVFSCKNIELHKNNFVFCPSPQASLLYVLAHFSLESRVQNVRIPNSVFFPNPTSRVHILTNPAFQVAFKSGIPLMFPESRNVFQSNLGSLKYPSRPRSNKLSILILQKIKTRLMLSFLTLNQSQRLFLMGVSSSSSRSNVSTSIFSPSGMHCLTSITSPIFSICLVTVHTSPA